MPVVPGVDLIAEVLTEMVHALGTEVSDRSRHGGVASKFQQARYANGVFAFVEFHVPDEEAGVEAFDVGDLAQESLPELRCEAFVLREQDDRRVEVVAALNVLHHVDHLSVWSREDRQVRQRAHEHLGVTFAELLVKLFEQRFELLGAVPFGQSSAVDLHQPCREEAAPVDLLPDPGAELGFGDGHEILLFARREGIRLASWTRLAKRAKLCVVVQGSLRECR